jgi:type VI secretion system protein ImpJ
MTKANKVLWKDGMFMYPHHLQQQDHYYENLINHHQLLQPYPNWGILTLEIDETYFNLNKILLRRCSGILPNGMFFDIPNRDNFPTPIEIPKDYNNKLVYLGIPINHKQTLNHVRTEKPGFRYYGEEELVNSSFEDEENQNIIINKLNLNFFLEGLRLYSCIPNFAACTNKGKTSSCRKLSAVFTISVGNTPSTL